MLCERLSAECQQKPYSNVLTEAVGLAWGADTMSVKSIDVKKRFLRFFYLGHVLYVFFQTFLF